MFIASRPMFRGNNLDSEPVMFILFQMTSFIIDDMFSHDFSINITFIQRNILYS